MSIRMGRIGSQMQKSLAVIIDSKIKDPAITGMVSVTKVECASDLKTAKVYITMLGDGLNIAVVALNNSAGFIRKELASDMRDIRTVPALTFLPDLSMQKAQEIDNILADIKNEI